MTSRGPAADRVPHPADRLTIGQVATRTGIAVSAIRFYEARGLVAPIRNDGGQRRFRRSDIRRLSFVRMAQQFGFSIEQIRAALAELPLERMPSQTDWQRLSEQMRARLQQQIDALTRLRDRLDGCIGCGCLSLEHCRLFNPDDHAAALGAGPRWVLGDRPGDAS